MRVVLRKGSLFLAVLVVVGQVALGRADDTVGPGFRVAFPATPSTGTKKAAFPSGPVEFHRFTARQGNVFAFVFTWEHHQADRDKVVAEIWDGTIKPMGQPLKLLGEKELATEPTRVREYLWGKTTFPEMLQRVYVTPKRAYVVGVATEDDTPVEKNAVALEFARSFKLE